MKSTTSGLAMVWRVDSKLLTEIKNSLVAYGFEDWKKWMFFEKSDIIYGGKYIGAGINMDVGCMVDGAWIESLKNGGKGDGIVPSRDKIISGFHIVL